MLSTLRWLAAARVAGFAMALVGAGLGCAAGALAGEPVFGEKPGHVWDAARDAFYLRRFSEKEVFDHPHLFAPPYREYQPFVFDAAFYDQVVAKLDALQKLPAKEMEEQPAVRRVVLLRDLWAAFDGLLAGRVKVDGDAELSAKAAARHDDLLKRVAAVMRRLELSEREARTLPNALAMLRDKKTYPKEFDPAAPERPFVPTDLLDQDGPWVAYSREEAPTLGGVLHIQHVQARSLFTLHMHAPGGRAETEKFLVKFRESKGTLNVPTGTTLALLRRAIAPTREGKLVATPMIESLQLIVVTAGSDIRAKYVLERKDFVRGGTGLTLLTKDDPVDTSDFEAGVSVPQNATTTAWESNPPQESLVLEWYKTAAQLPRSMKICNACHGERTRTNILANFKTPYVQRDAEAADATVLKQKGASDEWKTYLRLRERAGK
jgi:hypothetical protein